MCIEMFNTELRLTFILFFKSQFRVIYMKPIWNQSTILSFHILEFVSDVINRGKLEQSISCRWHLKLLDLIAVNSFQTNSPNIVIVTPASALTE